MVDTSLLDLFKMEVEQQCSLLSDSLLALDENPTAPDHLEASMRASHSVKGAARLIGVGTVQQLAHVMEDCLVAAQEDRLLLNGDSIDVLLKATDMIAQIADDDDIERWADVDHPDVNHLCERLSKVLAGEDLSEDQAAAPEVSVETDLEPEPEAIEQVQDSITKPQVPVEIDTSLLELFCIECTQQCKTLGDVLLDLEQDPQSAESLEELMRAAHSIKGAARLIGLPSIVELAHVVEDDFVAAQNGELILGSDDIDLMLKAVDVMAGLASCDDVVSYLDQQQATIDQLLPQLAAIKTGVLSDNKDVAQPVTESAPKLEASPSIPAGMQDQSMYELFRVECEQHGSVLSEGLLALEQDPESPARLEPLMRAAHSIKGAARLVSVDLVVKLAHVMEDDFVAAQNGDIQLDASQVDVLLEGLDVINELAFYDGGLENWQDKHQARYETLLTNLEAILRGEKPAKKVQTASPPPKPATAAAAVTETAAPATAKAEGPKKAAVLQKDRVLRISADQVNRLMGLAGESLVESRWLYPYSESLRRLKRQQTELVCMVDNLREHMERGSVSDELRSILRNVQKQASHCREIMSDRLTELESYDRRSSNLSSRLHREVVESRMRPFGDGVHGFPRMVRDISRSLSKDVQLVIEGESTLVDRDILDKIEAPLNHLIRNAIDHGLETAEERSQTDKAAKGTIKLGAHHHSGMLSIIVQDDGRGVNLENLRQKVIDKGLVDAAMAKTLTESELLDFLFLPSFSTKEQVSEISGRGVGLDVVHDVVQEMRGNVKATSTLGKGTKFHLQLPLTLSVIPALIVEIAAEPYAFPLARIERIVSIEAEMVQEAEGNQFVTLDGKHIGLVGAAQILEKDVELERGNRLSIVVLHERNHYYGMVVDKFLGERELVVQVMPEALGKVQDISTAALMEDGSPVLIVDVDDLIRSIEKVLKATRLSKVSAIYDEAPSKYKRVLVVDDSITVREVERKLLESAGYEVETAVDGADGLNMLRSMPFDMLVTDVDMPRMNGLDLVKTIRQDSAMSAMPVLMVSYKDREEDRVRGLEAGADYYLTKGSFHDETLLQAVIDLIGEAKV